MENQVKELTALESDEYLNIKFPFWYWGTFISLMAIAIITLVVGALASVFLHLPLLAENVETPFVLSGVIAFVFSIFSGYMLIFGIIIFPKEIKKRK